MLYVSIRVYVMAHGLMHATFIISHQGKCHGIILHILTLDHGVKCENHDWCAKP